MYAIFIICLSKSRIAQYYQGCLLKLKMYFNNFLCTCSCTFSQRKKELKYDVHRRNQEVSVQLTKAQRKLRYLAGHENMSDKNVLINMAQLATESEVPDEDDSVIADKTATTILSENDLMEDKPPSYSVTRDKKSKRPVQFEEFSDPPPSYVYPKHLLPDQTYLIN